ncbi:MAG: rhodanese-like domain-containing protein [Pseudomonadota bacterium]
MAITPVKDLVAAAKSEISSLAPDAVIEAHARDEILLVDIRDPRELSKAGRVPGAFHAPRGMLEFWVDPASPYHKSAFSTDRPIVLFCASAWRSALSAKTLQDMGMTNVAELAGGFSAWVAAGGPVDSDDA